MVVSHVSLYIMWRIVFLAVFLNSSAAFAQPVFFETWFGDASEYDYARSVKQISSGSVFVAGFMSNGPNGDMDVALYKLDRYGNLQWTSYYGDSHTNVCMFLSVCSDGNLLLCGETHTGSNGMDAFLYKIDTTGNVIWYQTYGSLQNESVRFVSETQNGDFILSGFVSGLGGNENYLLRTDAQGNERWNARYGGADNEYASCVRELPGGDLLLSADTRSTGQGGYDVELIRIDSLGNVRWDYTYGDAFQNGSQGFLVTGDQHFVIYGETEAATNGAFQFYLEKTDSSGTSLWRRTFGGSNTADAAFSAVELTDGYMLCGYSNTYMQGPISVVVLKTDTAGQLIWAHPFGLAGIDIGYEIIASQNNGFYVIGTSNVDGDDQCYLLHIDGNGWTGIPEYDAGETLSVFPNPASDFITVGLIDKQVPETIRLFDLSGKEQPVTREKGSARIALPETAQGFYILEAGANGKVLRSKVFVY